MRRGCTLYVEEAVKGVARSDYYEGEMKVVMIGMRRG